MRRSSRSLSSLALALIAISASCTVGGGSPDEALARQPSKVTVKMVEYRFVYGNRVAAGRVVFEVANAGRSPHRLSLFAVADDAPPIDVQVRALEGLQLAPLVEMPVLQPGEQGSFAADLKPGLRYTMVSLWPSSEGKLDALLGMATEFRTARSPRTATARSP